MECMFPKKKKCKSCQYIASDNGSTKAGNSSAGSTRLELDSTRLGSDKFVMRQATIFAQFVNEVAQANSQAARETNKLESKRCNVGSRDIKAKPHLNLPLEGWCMGGNHCFTGMAPADAVGNGGWCQPPMWSVFGLGGPTYCLQPLLPYASGFCCVRRACDPIAVVCGSSLAQMALCAAFGSRCCTQQWLRYIFEIMNLIFIFEKSRKNI
jgi:hypothetical protein